MKTIRVLICLITFTSFFSEKSKGQCPVTIMGPTTACPGAQFTLTAVTASSPFSYSWSTGATSFQIMDSQPVGVHIYSVTVTPTSGGIPCEASHEVTITAGISVTASNNGPKCTGQPITLSTSGAPIGSTFSWSGPGGFSSTQQNPIIANQSGTYTVLVTNNGCTGTASTAVVFNSIPIATASSNSPVCSGNAINLTSGGGGTSYQWSGPGGFGSNQQNPTNAILAGTYTVTVTNSSNCTATASTTVIINQTPTAMASSNSPCAGQAINLSSNGGGSYQWSGPGGFSSNQQNPNNATQSGNYTVTVTNNSCSSIASTTVTINPNPIVNAGNDVTLCGGGNTPLNASVSPAGTYNFAWSNGFMGQSQNVQPTMNTVFTVTATNTTTGCSGTDMISVSISGPNVQISSNPSNLELCAGESRALTASGGNSYEWSNGLGTSATIAVLPTFSNNSFTVTATDVNNCKASKTIMFSVNPLPNVNLGSNQSICNGANVTLNANPSNGTGSYNFNWSFGLPSMQSNTVSPVSTTDYTVTATDSKGCSGVGSVKVTVNPAITVSITANPDAKICPGDPVILTASANGGSGGFTFQWDNSLGSGSMKTAMPIPSNPTYNVTATDNFISSNGSKCTATASKTIAFKAAVSVSPTQEGPYCEGATIKLHANATNATSFQWSGPGGVSIPADANPTIANAAIAMNGTYTVTASGGSVCPGIASVIVTIIEKPTISIQAGNFTICNGQKTTLTSITTPVAGLISTITWQQKNAAGNYVDITSGTSFNTPTLSQTTTYRAKIEHIPLSADCDTALSADVIVTVVNNPHIDIIGPTTICKNQQTAYQIKTDVPIAGTTITWQVKGVSPANVTNENGLIFVHWGTIAGSVIVFQKIGSGSANCSFSDTINVTVSTAANSIALPDSGIGYFKPNNILICKNDGADCYRWGYYDKNLNKSVTLGDEIFQAYGAGNEFKDTTDYVYWVKTWKAPCTDSACATVSFRTQTIDENPATKFNIALYPNPNNGDFKLEVQPLPSGEYELDIYDPIGRLVYKKPVWVGFDAILNEIVQTTIYANGLYFAVLRRENAVFLTRAFVVQN